MSKYYKAEDILAIFNEGERPLNWTDSESEIQEVNDFYYYKGVIESLPTIDIVQCYECKCCRDELIEEHMPLYIYCEKWKHETDFDGFCKYGERIENE